MQGPKEVGDLLEELLEHVVGDLLGSIAVKFEDLLALRIVRVECAEHALAVAEQDQEVLALGAHDLLQDALLGLAVHHTREDAILDRVQDDGTVGTRSRLLVQLRSAVEIHSAGTDVTGAVVESAASARAPFTYQTGRKASGSCEN